MVHADFQEALKQLSTDEEYREALDSNVEYGMNEEGLLAIRSIDPISIQKEEFRPVAWCCTCWAAE